MAVENIIVGELLVHPKELFAIDENDWKVNESKLTHLTSLRFLPDVLRECKLTTESNSWFRKNKPELLIELNDFNFFQFKLGKKKSLITIAVGK